MIAELTENCASGDRMRFVKKIIGGRAEVTFAHRAKVKSTDKGGVDSTSEESMSDTSLIVMSRSHLPHT